MTARCCSKAEPGTGKRTLAEQIHRQSQRGKAGAACEVLHCDDGAVQDRLLGVMQPNASGVLVPSVSSVELAEGGTLILAGIEHLQKPAQLALLELLEDPAMIFIRPGAGTAFPPMSGSLPRPTVCCGRCWTICLMAILFTG